MFLVSLEAIEAASSLSEPFQNCWALSFSKTMLPTITIARGLSRDRSNRRRSARRMPEPPPTPLRTIRQLRGPNWPPAWR